MRKGFEDWESINFTYPIELKRKYDTENEFDHWFVKHYGKWPFHESILNSNQIPHSRRPLEFSKNKPRSFDELYMAVQYLDAGYEVHLSYRGKEHKSDLSHNEVVRILGRVDPEILRFGQGGEPPDMLVVRPGTNQFRFVECKMQDEAPTKDQIERFHKIEDSLNRNLPPCGKPLSDSSYPELFPPLDPGRWIHIVYLVPDNVVSDEKALTQR